jgi:hypothetical protein
MLLKPRLGRRRIRLPAVHCYSFTVFTQNWREVRDFYTYLLGGRVVSEREHRYTDLLIGGLPICFRTCENGEGISHFHLYFALLNRQPILERLQEAGVILRLDGTYASFLDPEGRTIKLSKEVAVQ